MGIRPSDIVAMTFPVGMSGGGVKHADAYVGVGAKVLRIANLSTRAKLDAMAYYGTTVLIATPFYVDRLGAVAAEAGIDVRVLKVRKIVVATQSVTVRLGAIDRREVGRQALRMVRHLGRADRVLMRARHGQRSDGERGTLHWDPDFQLNEILDVESGALVQGGERGELVGTPLVSAAEPLFRIRTRDEVTFRAPGTCRCGSPWPGIESGTVRRLDSMFKVKGVNVWPSPRRGGAVRMGNIRDYRVRIAVDGARARDDAHGRVDQPMHGRRSTSPERLSARLRARDRARLRRYGEREVVAMAASDDRRGGKDPALDRRANERGGARMKDIRCSVRASSAALALASLRCRSGAGAASSCGSESSGRISGWRGRKSPNRRDSSRSTGWTWR